MADWYYMAGGEKFGPVSNDELKKLAAAGHFEPTDKVWKEGLQDWVDASTMKGLFDGRPAKTAEGATKTASAASKRKASKPRVNGEHPGYLPHLKFVDKFLDLARGILSEKLLDSLDGICRMAGHISLMVYVVICLGMGIFIGIKVDSFRLVLMASAILPIGLAGQYVAARFLSCSADLINKSPSRLVSTATPDCFGLICILYGLTMLVVGVWQGIEMKSFQVAGYGLILALGSFYAAGVSLNLNSVNINLSEEATTGEEAIGIISLAMKIMLKSIAVIFGLLMCYEAIGLVKTAYGMIQSNRFAISARQMHAIGRGAGIALLPFAAYLGYTVYYLLLDVLRAILQIPQKLDDMNG